MENFSQLRLFHRDNRMMSEFESTLGDYLPLIKSAILNSFAELQKERSIKRPRDLNRNWNANTMNGFIHGQLLDLVPEYFVELNHGRFGVRFPDKFLLLFKKLNKNLHPESISTLTSNNYLDQLTTSDSETETVVFIGFTVNKTWDQITGIFAVNIISGVIDWVFDFDDIGKNISIQGPRSSGPFDDIDSGLSIAK